MGHRLSEYIELRENWAAENHSGPRAKSDICWLPCSICCCCPSTQVCCGRSARRCITPVYESTCWTTTTGSTSSYCLCICRRTCFVFSSSSAFGSPTGTTTARRAPARPCFSTTSLCTTAFETRYSPMASSRHTATSWRPVRRLRTVFSCAISPTCNKVAFTPGAVLHGKTGYVCMHWRRLIAHDDASRMGRGVSSVCVCLFVCFFSYDVSKTDAATITKLDIEMFHHESWKCIYFGVERSKDKVTRHKKTLPAWVLALLWVLASFSFHVLSLHHTSARFL